MNKHIIITGATGGIGREVSRQLSEQYQLTLFSRDAVKLARLKEELCINSKCNPIEFQPLDFSDLASIQTYQNTLKNVSSTWDGLVIITQRPLPSAALLPTSEEWQALFNTAFIGPAELIRIVLPFLTKTAKIVILSGIASVQYMPGKLLYSVLRKMWLAHAKALAYELGPRGICVNTVSPGGVMTTEGMVRMQNKAKANNISFEAQYQESISNVPLGKYAMPADIAEIIAFFLSDRASHITGTNLVCDGGFNRGF